MIQKITKSTQSVVAWARHQTADNEQLKLDSSFLTEELVNTVATGSGLLDDLGRIQTGERSRTFSASLHFIHADSKTKLVFHRGDPACSIETRDTQIIIPDTVVDGFWLRRKAATRKLLAKAALSIAIPPKLRKVLTATLVEINEVVGKAISRIDLKSISVVNSSGMLFRRPREIHINLPEFQTQLIQNIVQQAKPKLTQVLYCLGRQDSGLKRDWRKALDSVTPATTTHEDRESEKWLNRIQFMQAYGLIDEKEQLVWSKIDKVTHSGERLEKFIDKSICSQRVGMKRMINNFGMLTADSQPDNWHVASMVRVLHYFLATVQKNGGQKKLKSMLTDCR